MNRLNKIERLKDQLHETDYRVLKNIECEMISISPVYDPSELHSQRQAIRDEINLIEQMTDEEYYEQYPEEEIVMDDEIEDIEEIPEDSPIE